MNVDVRRGRFVSTIFGRGLTEIDTKLFRRIHSREVHFHLKRIVKAGDVVLKSHTPFSRQKLGSFGSHHIK